MKPFVVSAFLLLRLIVFSQDSCVNYQPNCHYCEVPSLAYHDNGEIAFKSRQFFGVKKSKHWNCQGNVTRKITSYRRFKNKRGKSKYWTATYYPNGQLKEIKKFLLVDCYHFRKMRLKQFDQNGKRIRE